MKVVILAGGLGTRLREETEVKPKPMVEIGGRPILWHIMKLYAHHGFNDFVLCLGYKGEVIKRLLPRLRRAAAATSPSTLATARASRSHDEHDERGWRCTLVDTGAETHDRRPRQARCAATSTARPFMVDLRRRRRRHRPAALLAFHRSARQARHGHGVRPPARFGELDVDGRRGRGASARSRRSDEGWINGGFFVFEPEVLDYIAGDDDEPGGEPLERLAARASSWRTSTTASGSAWTPSARCSCSNELWAQGRAPWKVWARERAPSGAGGASSSPGTPASRAAGWLVWLLLDSAPRSSALALRPDREPSSVRAARLDRACDRRDGDVRDRGALERARRRQHELDSVFHLAAQALVRRAYREPVGTFATNVMGTGARARGLPPARRSRRAVVVVTSDKCLRRTRARCRYRESDAARRPRSLRRAARAARTDRASAYRRRPTSLPVGLARPRRQRHRRRRLGCETASCRARSARSLHGERPVVRNRRHVRAVAARRWTPLGGYLALAGLPRGAGDSPRR